MTTFQDLIISGKELNKFVETFEKFVKDTFVEKWQIDNHDDVFFVENTYEKATVCLVYQNYELRKKIEVTNVIPTDNNALSVEKYNKVLTEFADEILSNYKNKKKISIEFIKTTGEMTLKDIFGTTNEKLLLEFLDYAKFLSPLEIQRDLYRSKTWNDFILGTFVNGRLCYNFDELESYIDEMINDREKARFLSTEYIRTIYLLSYYEGEYKYNNER